MAQQNTPHSSDNESENTNIPNTYVRSKARVFFVRHGKTEEDTGEMDSVPQGNESPLDHRGVRQMQAAGVYLKIAGISSGDSQIMFSNDTVRSVESAMEITKKLIQGNLTQLIITDKLRTTKKGLKNEDRIMENGEVFIATVELMKQIRKEVNYSLEKSTSFILVGHKSNKSGSEQAADNINEAIDISFDIENGGIIERDIDVLTGKYIDPKKHPETLFLNRENYNEILKPLEDIPELNDLIIKFRRNTQIESGKYPIWELQNDLNEYFHSNKVMFGKYIIQSSPVHLRLFCLANLIIQKDYNAIENYYLSPECKSLADTEKEAILQNTKNNPAIKKIFRQLFISRPELWEDRDQILIENSMGMEGYVSLIHLRKELQNTLTSSHDRAERIFTNSLDDLVKSGELLRRGLHRFVRKPENEIEKLKKEKGSLSKEEEYNQVASGLSEILTSEPSCRVLLGHVGDGKSTELARMKREMENEPRYTSEYISLLYSAKVNNIDPIGTIEQEIQRIRAIFPDKKIVVFFDGIDELDGKIRDGVVSFLENLSGAGSKIWTILGSRPSSFDLYSEGSMGFDGINAADRKEFLISRLRSLKISEDLLDGKFREIEAFLSGNILEEDLKSTPLILFFLCKLVLKLKNKETLNETIKNRSDLYRRMATLLLTEHQGKKLELKWTSGDIDIFMNTLSFCAFQKFTKKNIQKNNILDHLRKALEYRESFDDPEEKIEAMVDQIFLLYKNEGGEYQFILKSFEEYFLARYLTKEPDGSSAIFKKRDESMAGNWNNWRELRPVVMFYGEILANNENWNELEQFLGEDGILKNDDIFGEGFFMGLEIVHILNKKNINEIKKILMKYMELISNWDINELMEKFEATRKFVKKLGYQDTEITQNIIFTIKKNINTRKNTFSTDDENIAIKIYNFSTLAANISSPESIERAVKGVKSLQKLNKHNVNGICADITLNGDFNTREIMFLMAQNAIADNDFFLASAIYSAILKNGSNIEKGRISTEINKIIQYIKENLSEGINCNGENGFKGILCVCDAVVSIEVPEVLIGLRDIAYELMKMDRFKDASWIFWYMASSGTYESSHEALIGAELLLSKLIEGRLYLESDDKQEMPGKIYEMIIEMGSPQLEFKAIEGAKKLQQMGYLNQVSSIYKVIERHNKNNDKVLSVSKHDILSKIHEARNDIANLTMGLDFARKSYQKLQMLPIYISGK